ncbi:MAG: CoA transferase [Planctomycetes bacterium]|nr:CoA transferase [Planctomycetota bacterium]
MSLLQGYRVLECGLIMQGPLTATALADLGADVIKVESTDSPDPIRGNEQFWGIDMRLRSELGEVNICFESVNRGKRGMTLNLKSERGRALLYALVKQCDVFIQNWSPRVSTQLGFDYESVRAHNPRIVYLESTGFGTSGPYSGAPGMDPVGAGFSGLMYLPSAEAKEPQYPIGGFGDNSGALMGVAAILAALLARERTGEGQHLEVSQIGALFWLESLPVIGATATGNVMARVPRERERNPLFNIYRCADERWIVLGEWQPERKLADFYMALGRSDLWTDARFNSFRGILENHVELIAVLDRVFAGRPSGEWIAALSERSILVGPVNTVLEATREPQMLANGYLQEYDHPGYGPIRAAALPIKCGGTPLPIAGAAPSWGQHTEEVLMELLGLEWEDLTALRDAGVI